MSINFGTLRGELLSDPLSIGYSGKISVGDDQGNADLLNAIRSGNTVFRNDISVREIIQVIQPTDFTNLTQIQLSKLNLLFLSAPLDANLSGLRNNFQNIFSGTATQLSGFLVSGLAQRFGSRAETLFGTGTGIFALDISNALRHTSGGFPASGYPFIG